MKTQQFSGAKKQFMLTDDNGNILFQSYSTIICKRETNGRITLDTEWDNTATTNKYRCQFLGEKKSETLAKIKSGEYKVEDLNR